MVSNKVKRIVQEYSDISSKPDWVDALRLAREELKQVEDRAQILRESIATFETLVSSPAEPHVV
ncbi:hypothetical protein SBA7_380024 [Candidatus Sulfotelmatobacter sp. SbA7]|nr:hypothetical protein SBA7_380024 [Candidatus Sulfotelmatobacter sp. SbA7]